MTQPATVAGATLPAAVDVLAGEVVALYARAEQQLAASLAVAARHGFTDSSITAQLAMFVRMRQVAQQIVTALQLRSGPLAARVASEATQHGEAAAQRMIQQAVAGHPSLAALYLKRAEGITGHGVAAANAIALELAGKLNATGTGILRYADDAYRAATAETATRLVLGREGLTPASAQNLAWSELTRAGVTGFTDKAGHQWNLSTYVEMATRTAVQRAYNTSHQDRMTSVGIDYFTVASDGRPCPLCLPFEGAVLSNGQIGPVVEPAADTGKPVRFTVTATVDDARAAGLFHPNCKHVLIPYLPGVTRTAPPRAWTDRDQAAYDATQQLRALERQVRALKRAQLGALDDLSRRRIGRQIRATQARIRDHVEQHGLNRRSRREQLDLGNR